MALDAARLPARRPPDPSAREGAPDWWPHAAEFPDWHVWRGVAGLLYARRPKSSPPKVVHGKNVASLREQIQVAQVVWPPPADAGHAGAAVELAHRQQEQDRFGGPMPAGL